MEAERARRIRELELASGPHAFWRHPRVREACLWDCVAIDGRFFPVREVRVDAEGNKRRYWSGHLVDHFGFLRADPIDADKSDFERVERSQFVAFWNNAQSIGCTMCGQGEVWAVEHGAARIALVCDECDAVWQSPDDLGTDRVATAVVLDQRHRDYRWATPTQVEAKGWPSIFVR